MVWKWLVLANKLDILLPKRSQSSAVVFSYEKIFRLCLLLRGVSGEKFVYQVVVRMLWSLSVIPFGLIKVGESKSSRILDEVQISSIWEVRPLPFQVGSEIL